ncbi:MAG: malectin domain-containing carbohydrate-binding protein, partial [Ignavibacteria bacterium]|nr:malectin domain-containing carbohydrate-binding protein [Ignavibacteria bacterium]
GTFTNVAAAAGVERSVLPGNMASVTWGTVFFDYNNDQFLDLFFAAGPISTPTLYQPDAFFENNEDGTFTDISEAAGLNDPRMARCSSIADFDGDGFMDLFVGRYGMAPSLYRNEAFDLGNTYQWLTVTVEGTISNRDGIGARVILETPDGVSQIREMTSGPTYGGGDQRIALFGMRNNLEGTLTVRWPTGSEQVIGTVASGQTIHVIEEEDDPGPWLTEIPDQKINQTQPAFLPIVLDQYINHPVQPDSLIAWSISGEDHILITIDSGRVALATRIDSSWIGADTVSFMATDTAGVSYSEDVVFISSLEYRMNIGGDSVTTNDGRFFQAEEEYTGGGFGIVGGTSRVYSVGISSTEDDILYQTVRQGLSGFELTLDSIPNGTYDVTLHFIEPLRTRSGTRILDVIAEDVLVLDDFNVFAKAGGIFKATSELVSATVVDSQLNISLLPSNGKSILVCAIEIQFMGQQSAEFGRNGLVASAVTTTTELPSEFMLHQNYPNPFNPSTTIRYDVTKAGSVHLSIYDMLGRHVATILDQTSPAGRHTAVWNGTDHSGRPVSSGVYFYRLRTPEGVAMRRMILAK